MRPFFCLLLAVSGLAAADKPSREILELQREVAQLDDKIGALKQALETRLTAMSTQIQGVADAAGKINASVGALEKAIGQVSTDQDRKILPAIAAQGTRLDQFGTSFSSMQQALSDLTTAVNRLQTQVLDVSNAVKVIQTPSTPPKPSASDLLQSASADQLGGKYDLAVQGYVDFLKYYGDTAEADTALFGLGMTHYQMQDFESAARDFDALAAKLPDSKKVPEALLYKSKSLTTLKRPAEARAACQQLRKKFPTSEFVKQCPVAAR